MKAYCVKCRKKIDIKNPIVGKTKRGVPITKGVCKICGTNVSAFGK